MCKWCTRAAGSDIFATSAKTKLVVIILDVPVIAKRWLKCSTSEVCPPKLYFQSGRGTVGPEEKTFSLL